MPVRIFGGNHPRARRRIACPYVYQGRFLDAKGREVVRVDRHDGRLVTVAENGLQDKSDRYYVHEGLAHESGQAQLLRLEDGAHCREARQIAEHKLADMRVRLADLQRVETALQALVEACAAASGTIRCPLIGALQAHA